MCPACQAEYRHPRRPPLPLGDQLLPRLRPAALVRGSQRASGSTRRSRLFAAAAVLLAAGGIVAVRGLGGFHLAVDATSSAAVARLRDPQAPRGEAVRGDGPHPGRGPPASPRSATPRPSLLGSTARPVVLVRLRADHRLAPEVAPGLDTVGLMLPSTPLHHLLLEAAGRPLVMTSGNLSEEPIAIGNDEAPRAPRRHRRRLPDARPRDRGPLRRLGGPGRRR